MSFQMILTCIFQTSFVYLYLLKDVIAQWIEAGIPLTNVWILQTDGFSHRYVKIWCIFALHIMKIWWNEMRLLHSLKVLQLHNKTVNFWLYYY